jgi:branched-chain amino acid transport system ATP-binding protein
VSAALFAFEGLTGGYGGSTVVRGVAGAVERGQLLCITGRNGVGKSTLLKLLFGYLRPFAGHVSWRGEDVTALAPELRRSRGMSYAPQERIVFDELTVRENLTLMRTSRAVDRFASYFARFPVLGARLGQRAGTLSGGEKKILSLVRALAEESALVMLDEPTEGVQQENIDKMQAIIAAAKAGGTAFIAIEQNITFAQAVADRILVMDQGRVVFDSPMAATGREQIIGYLQP